MAYGRPHVSNNGVISVPFQSTDEESSHRLQPTHLRANRWDLMVLPDRAGVLAPAKRVLLQKNARQTSHRQVEVLN